MAKERKPSSFDEIVYDAVHRIIEQHDEELVAAKVRASDLEEANNVLAESLKSLRAKTRKWQVDLTKTAFASPAELLRGRIYALVSSFPQSYRIEEE